MAAKMSYLVVFNGCVSFPKRVVVCVAGFRFVLNWSKLVMYDTRMDMERRT